MYLSTEALPASSRTVRSAPGFSDQARQTEPFAAIPHRVRDDIKAGKLKLGDHAVLAELIGWARSRATTDATVGQIAHALGIGERAVQFALGRLEAAGWIRRERDHAGRIIGQRKHLLWKSSPSGMAHAEPPVGERRCAGGRIPIHPPAHRRSPFGAHEIAPSGEVVVVEKVETKPGEAQTAEKCLPQRQRPEPPTGETPPPIEATAPDPGSAPNPPCEFLASLHPAQRARLASESSFKRGPVLRQFAESGLTPEQRQAFDGMMTELKAKVRRDLISGDPERTWKGFEAILRNCKPASRAPRPDDLPTLDLIAGKDSDPTFPLALANRLSVEFRDSKSFRGFEAKLKVYPPEALVDAYQQARNPKAKKPGAIFMHALKRHEEA